MGKRKDKMVAVVRAAAQELIDKADEMICSGDTATDLDIWLRFRPGEVPEIEVQRKFLSAKAWSVDTGIQIVNVDPAGDE